LPVNLPNSDGAGRLLSIVVPAFNEEKLLAKTLARIRNAAQILEMRGWSYELIVSDNNSTDRTADIAKEAGAQVVFEPINQIGRARNRGAENAQGNWILFIDADSQPSCGLLEKMLDQIESGRVAAIGSTLRFDDVDWAFAFVAWFWKVWSVTVSHMAGSFIAVDTVAFRAIGGFSTEFFVGEELDLSRRLTRWGKQQRPCRSVRVLTGEPLLTSGRKAKLYTWGESAKFLGQVILSPLGTMKRKDRCDIWYDGRR
jgi:glycosyltransferase involved in cell wall biosynthesis